MIGLAQLTGGRPGPVPPGSVLDPSEVASGAYLISFTWFYSCLGEKDQAFEWLERAYVARAGMLVYLKVDPQYDGLRSDPRWAALVKKMGLKP